MWQIKRVKATNIQTIKELDYTLEQGVTTLFFGENNDNPTQKSNGSGKSTLLEIISLGIIGNAVRPVRIDEVINNDETKGTTDIELFNIDTGVTMIISRTFYKKSGSEIYLYMSKDGVDIPESDYVQSSLSEYKKFIFNELGITEDEFVNNFILSKHKYKSFFDSSDREKKEIINNLSNAVIVDPAIAKLDADIESQKGELNAVKLKLAANDGSINVINDQIEKIQSDEDANPKAKKIQDLQNSLDEYHTSLHESSESIDNLKTTGYAIDKVAKIVENIIYEGNMEEWGDKLSHTDFKTDDIDASEMGVRFKQLIIEELNNNKKSEQSILDYKDVIVDIKKNMNKSETLISNLKVKKEAIDNKINSISDQCEESSSDNKKSIQEIKIEVENINAILLECESKSSIFTKKINDLKNIIAGTITCPNCKFEFLLNSEDISLEEAKDNLTSISLEFEEVKNIDSENREEKIIIQNKKQDLFNKIKKLEDDRDDQIKVLESELFVISKEIKDELKNINLYTDEITDFENNISKLSVKISRSEKALKDTIYEEIDRVISRNKRHISKEEDHNSFILAQIETAENNIKTLNESSIDDAILSFQKTKEELLKEREKTNLFFNKEQANLDLLISQKGTFDEFKTHLANSKIEALSYEINYFLERINTDIRVDISGYTVNKAGKVSDKIYTSIIRDGIDFGNLYKLSEGEKATIHIATILARQKLINSSADSSKGVNFLFIDEILDSIDYNGLNKIFNIINEYGTTAIIISHGNILESYPYRMKVVKTNGVSELVEQ